MNKTENTEQASLAPAQMTIQDALGFIQNKLAPEPKTYEDGLAEGKLQGREDILDKATKIAEWAGARAKNFGSAHSGTPAGKAFEQLGDDVMSRIDSLRGSSES
mgnify:CR=1 FL=1|tara:strand:+ start:9491 stop:9802 length:312 start_codon:yes stop_codon:yes gene_type:complete